ncbi:hypothetical protein HKBW3S42_00888 [Candidatus Hakubella thermalkaliphila]|uniref:Uncharacterized protein n=1 Tax=Candidatus Hakubella thermalkaliphila TaxID=2754717 RepID=A0A6V8PLG6_9ACTN|nr:hypothetical protein [Bacillota bacterium]GFP32584.1 hypothetical protein HKBW3S42_00888 [Candidatus Hakubella thermalkaliphila]
MINQVVKPILIELFLLPSNIRNPVADNIAGPYSVQKRERLFFDWKELNL